MSTHHLGAILTVTTDRFVCPNGIDDLYALLNDMTGDNLMTHQLTRAADECKPVLLVQFPQLANVLVPAEFAGEAHVWRWLAEQCELFGTWFDVAPLAAEDHTAIDPIAELQMKRPDASVIAIELPKEQQ